MNRVTGKCDACTRPPPPKPKDTGKTPFYTRRVCQTCGAPYLGEFCPNGHARDAQGDADEDRAEGFQLVDTRY